MAAAGINSIRFGVGWWVLAETAAECQPMVEGGYQQASANQTCLATCCFISSFAMAQTCVVCSTSPVLNAGKISVSLPCGLAPRSKH
jgi:hypothetical protein